jgi:Rhodopirellula transposase DDE domain
MNWRANQLVSYRVIIGLISAITTDKGLTVQCELDTNTYPKDVVVTDEEMSEINIISTEFHCEWSYTLQP